MRQPFGISPEEQKKSKSSDSPVYIKRTLYSQRLILRGFPSESVVFRITAGLLAQIHPPSSSSRFPSDMSKDFVLYTVAGAALFIQIPCQAFRHCHAYSLVDSVHYMGDCSICQEWAAFPDHPSTDKAHIAQRTQSTLCGFVRFSLLFGQ